MFCRKACGQKKRESRKSQKLVTPEQLRDAAVMDTAVSIAQVILGQTGAKHVQTYRIARKVGMLKHVETAFVESSNLIVKFKDGSPMQVIPVDDIIALATPTPEQVPDEMSDLGIELVFA